MIENEKYLSKEALEILFRIAEKSGVLSYSRQDDIKIIRNLVESGHIFQGRLLHDSPRSISYSITKKGFLALQTDLLWSAPNAHGEQHRIVALATDSLVDNAQLEQSNSANSRYV